MAPEIVVTAGDVIAFRAAPGNAHLIYDGATVRVVPQLSVERDYPATFVITTREDLPEVDPDAECYPAEFLAELLTGFADLLYADTQEG